MHRWLGVGLCLVFLMWFASGLAMMYWSYPEITAADRVSREKAIDGAQIHLSPAQAYARLQTDSPVTEAKIVMLGGRPIYRFRFERGDAAIYADTGEEAPDFPPELTRRVAEEWTSQSASAASVQENTEEDQWTVSGEFRRLRPMMKYSWPDGEEVYVSTVTGRVEQYTTRRSRIAAYFGAIPHWVYFTRLRKHAREWSKLVIWTSGIAAVAALLGIMVGVWMYSPAKPFRYGGAPSALPYTGWKRWHMILGLGFGLFAFTWALSGMLSMDPFPSWQSGDAEEIGARIENALRGGRLDLAAFDAKPPAKALEKAGAHGSVKELEMRMFAGTPVYRAITGASQAQVVSLDGNPAEDPDPAKLIEMLRRAARPAEATTIRMVTEYEAYYLDRQGELPLPVIFMQFDDPGRSMYYVDPKSAQIVRGYDGKSRWNRWLYHGLHSMDFPWLYKHRPAWDIVVIALMTGGLALCITSILLAFGVLRRKAAAIAR